MQQGLSNLKSTTELDKYLNLSKVHAFLPGIKLSLHSAIVEGKKIINTWLTSAGLKPISLITS